MARDTKSGLIQHFLQTFFHAEGAGLSDGQLLERYVQRREDAIFAALTRRHGPMVLSTCRRVLGNEQDAEDAFQAVFLVLARKAASIVPRERVGNWLYGVAHTTALRARVRNAQRRTRERQVVEMPEPEARPDERWNDLRPLLDEELSRLPDKYRVALVLCDLEERTIKDAAHQLGWPQGTLAGRLARARDMLAKRLTRRGVALSGGALVAILAENAVSARVSVRLMIATIEAAKRFAAGQAVSGLLSTQAAALTEGVLKTMFVSKIKSTAAMLVVMAAVGLSAAGGFYRAAEDDSPPQTRTLQRATVPEDPLIGTRVDDTPLTGTAQQVDGVATSEPIHKRLLPIGRMPRQALVSLDQGQLVVRTLSVMYEPITMASGGKTVTCYQMSELMKTTRYPIDSFKVYDMQAHAIGKKKLVELMKKEIVALVTSDPGAADPVMLRVFKEATLLFIIPVTAQPGGYAHTEPGGDYAAPPQAPVPAYTPMIHPGTSPQPAEPTVTMPPPTVSPQQYDYPIQPRSNPPAAAPPGPVVDPPAPVLPPSSAPPVDKRKSNRGGR